MESSDFFRFWEHFFDFFEEENALIMVSRALRHAYCYFFYFFRFAEFFSLLFEVYECGASRVYDVVYAVFEQDLSRNLVSGTGKRDSVMDLPYVGK